MFERPFAVAEQFYRYRWATNEKQRDMKNRICRVLFRARRMNSCLIEFVDNGQRECVSRFAVRKIK